MNRRQFLEAAAGAAAWSATGAGAAAEGANPMSVSHPKGEPALDTLARTFRLDHIVASGSWYDIGLAEGRQQRSTVRYTIYRYARLHAGSAGLRSLGEMSRRVERFLTRHFPEELAELNGIADGAEVDLPLLMAANFPGALAAVCRDSEPAPLRHEEQCSNIMFPSSEWGPLIGGTLDDDPLRFILTATPKEGIDFCCIMWPGWVACSWGGMNAAGLALCGASAGPLLDANKNSGGSQLPGLEGLMPQRVLLRACRTVAEALDRLRQRDMMIPGNLSLMDRSGRGVQVQGYREDGKTPRIFEMPPDRGLCCGNFFAWEITPDDFGRFPDRQAVFSRYMALKRGVERFQGCYSLDGMKHVLTGHEGDPAKSQSICNDGTIVAMIAAPTHGKLLFASRPPCVQGFADYSPAERGA